MYRAPLHIAKENIRFHGQLIRETVKQGAPIALQDCLVTLSFLVINSIVNSLGLVPSSFSQSLSAFVAQNAGAGKYDRAKRAMGSVFYGHTDPAMYPVFSAATEKAETLIFFTRPSALVRLSP